MDSTTRRYGYALMKILRLCIISILLVKSLSGVMAAQMKIQLGAKNARDDSSSGHSKKLEREEEVDTVFDHMIVYMMILKNPQTYLLLVQYLRAICY